MTPYIIITKTKFKKPFKVQHIGKNGEQLGNPQKFTRKENALNNCLRYLELLNGKKVKVEDHAWGNVKTEGPRVFWLNADGSQGFKNLK